MGRPSIAQSTRAKRKRVDADCDDEETIKGELKGDVAGASNDSKDDGDNGEADEYDTSDEDSDADGESTGVVLHNEDSEECPKYAVYDKEFVKTVNELRDIPKRALKILYESECTSKRVRGCTSNAEDLSHFPKPKREKVALLGNTGAGKYIDPECQMSFLTSCRKKLGFKLTTRPA